MTKMEPHVAILLAGSTGLVGRELAHLLQPENGHTHLHLLLRRPPGGPLADGVTPHGVDFAYLPHLPQARDAYCALGTTIKAAGSQAAFRAVDFDAVLAFATAARHAGVKRFAVVSALGADRRSGNFYNRVKGEMEAALEEVGFDTLVVARPSLLDGDRQSLGQPARPAERVALALTRPLAPLLPAALRPVKATTVARAMLVAMNDAQSGRRVLDSAEIQALGR